MRASPQALSVLTDPFALTPGFKDTEQPDGSKAYEDVVTGSWVVPFMVARALIHARPGLAAAEHAAERAALHPQRIRTLQRDR
jgi:hypothetical protein